LSAALLLTLTLAAAPAAVPPPAEPASLVLIVASNRGVRAGRPPLQYADDDGAKYFEVFSTIAGEDHTVLLTDFDGDTARLFPALLERVRSPSRSQLDLAVSKLARQSAELRRAGRAVRLHFVFAGHGDVDGGRGFLELADGPFTADDLQQLLRTVDATESHVILDSCNSFFVVSPRKPGGTRFATPRDAAEALARRLPDVGVFLSTSAQAEVFEWSELQSGVFSHAVRSGLLGAADANGDGHVSYEELAAFVDTAVADIKNPNFRPRVFARGPNGEDARAILDLPLARTALLVDEPGPVRLAVRDFDGLRWLDAHTEAGSVLRLWFPASVRARLEVDRLSAGGQGVHVDASYGLSAADGAPLRLAELRPSNAAVAMRGAGEIFQALFARPYGPAAFAAYLDQRLARLEAALGLEPLPFPAGNESSAGDPGRRERELPRGRGVFAGLRIGAVNPWISGRGALFSGGGGDGPRPSVSLAVGGDLSRFASGEVEVGYRHLGRSTWFFGYPSQGYLANPVPGTQLTLQTVPLSLNLRLQLPFLTPRPYLVVGGGVTFVRAVFDPPDFNATLRAGHTVPFLQAGAGFLVDLDRGLFVGLEARYSLLGDFRAFGARLSLSGLDTNAVFGVRR